MRIKYCPQRSDNFIQYQFNGESIAATINDQTDIFDFSTLLNDGQAEQVITTLPTNPIVSAKRIDGVLYIELLNFIDANATEEERFPTWQEV